jgi:lysyl-tRNA synthetase class 2
MKGRPHSGVIWRPVAVAATALSGLLSLTSAITPDVPWRHNLLSTVEPGPAMAFGHVLAAAGGLAQLVLAWGLMRRKRRAATATIAILCASALVHVAKGLDYEESAVALALAALLYVNRSAFARGGDRRARPGLVAATLAVGAVTAGYALYTMKLLLDDRAHTLGAAMTSAYHALATGGWWLRSGDPLSVALDLLLLTWLVAVAAFLRAWLAPAQAADGHTCEEHRRAAALVSEHAADSLAPFLLREDKAFFFAHGGVLAYRTLRETAVVSSDPVGPPGHGPLILADFMHHAEKRGWAVVVTAASGRYLPEYEALGLRALCIGNEAVVDPAAFSLEGRAMRKVRQSVHRLERYGYSIEVIHGRDLTPGLADQLALVDSRWRAAQPRMQGFAMTLGRLWGADEDASSVYVLARGPDERVTGFLHFVSYPGGLSLDAMRRLGGEPNGLNEALVSRALEHARDLGVTEVSLNFAGFAHLMAADAALKRRQQLLRWLLQRLHGRFQLERLASFNRKFVPAWRPRYLVYGTRTHLPIAALRVLQAEAYVRPPRPRRLRSGWQPLSRPVREPSAAQ